MKSGISTCCCHFNYDIVCRNVCLCLNTEIEGCLSVCVCLYVLWLSLRLSRGPFLQLFILLFSLSQLHVCIYVPIYCVGVEEEMDFLMPKWQYNASAVVCQSHQTVRGDFVPANHINLAFLRLYQWKPLYPHQQQQKYCIILV